MIPYTEQASNLFQNGSFENGGTWPDSWSSDAAAIWSSDDAQDGAKSLLISTDIGSVVSQGVSVEAGQTYNISLWVNAAGFAGTGITVFDSSDLYDGPGEAQFVINDVNDANGWTEKTGSFTATTSGVIQFRIFSTPGTAGTVYFDNLVLSAVESGNAAPVITSTPITSIESDAQYAYAIIATDADNDPLSFTAVTVPSWLAFDANSGILSGTPSVGDVGPHSISLSVSDGQLSDVQDFSITVTAAPDPYDNWKTTHGVTDDMADDDNDGMSNLMEFALGGDPNIVDGNNQQPLVNEVGANIEFSFHRGEASVAYTIEKCSDLVNWSEYATVNDSHGSVGGEATVLVPVSEMNEGKLFLRLKVEN